MTNTVSRRASQALDIALLPLTFVWWTLAYRWGLQLRRPGGQAEGTVRPIESLEFRPFAEIFDRKTPVVLTGVGKRWKAFSAWTPDTLVKALGAQEVTVNIASSRDRDFLQSFFNQTTTQMSFARLVDLVFGHRASEIGYYMMGGGWTFLGELARDLDVPHEVNGRRFFPAASGLWVGQQGNITALHYDSWHGFHGQIVGRKRVIMYAPADSNKLYPDAPFGRRLAATRLPTMCLSADRRDFPKLDRAVRFETVLNPGELLYIPPFWWHYVESLDDVISIALRYDPRWREAFHPGAFPVKYRTVWRPALLKVVKSITKTVSQ